MVLKEKLYDTFGDLIYAIAKADGEVQSVEVDTLNKMIELHSSKNEIIWSFDYNLKKDITVDQAYNKAIEVCRKNGPDEEYSYLLNIMVEVAKAYMGIVPRERIVLDGFVTDLKEKFIADLKSNSLMV